MRVGKEGVLVYPLGRNIKESILMRNCWTWTISLIRIRHLQARKRRKVLEEGEVRQATTVANMGLRMVARTDHPTGKRRPKATERLRRRMAARPVRQQMIKKRREKAKERRDRKMKERRDRKMEERRDQKMVAK